ncbi:hypothetical protein BG004_000936 [Podila humilis]|nr:hypothetical protein BG004_000936 [Podila humilis]
MSRPAYSGLGHGPQHHSRQHWWHPYELYHRASVVGSSTRWSRSIRATLEAVMVYLVSSKRRKNWFLSLILVSLVFTVLSAWYMLSQFHQHGFTQTPPTIPGDLSPSLVVPIAPEAGERRTRHRGKKRLPKKSKPIPGMDDAIDNGGSGSVKTTGAKTEKAAPKEDDKKSKPSPSKAPGIGSSGKAVDSNIDDDMRICDLGDITHGKWGDARNVPRSLNMVTERDLGWSGYGSAGCTPHIWNERYLLTPNVPSFATLDHNLGSKLALSRAPPTAKQDLEYALRSKQQTWQVDQSSMGLSKKGACRQPDMDALDLIEVLKRSPLVMVGDKFMELEYLALECIILGMQSQLQLEARLSGAEDIEPLEYQIETEMPSITELKLGPDKIYRKAKPGTMRIFDRVSNLTLATFIRSDVLWDFNIHPVQGPLSTLHPDCKLVAEVLLCEPTLVRPKEHNQGDTKGDQSWWKWWVSDRGPSNSGASEEEQETENGYSELSIGSDLDQDMINQEWTSVLKQIMEHERQNSVFPEDDPQDGKKVAAGSPRKPTVVISNGLFWKYDPREWSVDTILDTIASSQQGADKAAVLKVSRASRRNGRLTKAEQEQVKNYQDQRRKQLKQRYTTMLASSLEHLYKSWPELRVIVQTSVKPRSCEGSLNMMVENKGELSIEEQVEQEAAMLNALTKIVVARVQNPQYSFLDTTFLRLYKQPVPNKRQCRSFMLPDATITDIRSVSKSGSDLGLLPGCLRSQS